MADAGPANSLLLAETAPPPMHYFGDTHGLSKLRINDHIDHTKKDATSQSVFAAIRNPKGACHGHFHHEEGSDKFSVRRSFWNMKCCCVFSSIPDELLLSAVFHYLDVRDLAVTTRVCQRWRFMSLDRSLWSKIDLSNYAKSINDPTAAAMFKKFASTAVSIRLCQATQLTPRFLNNIAPSLDRLRELHLCNITQVKDQALVQIAMKATSLQDISLAGCSSITDASLQTLYQECKDLRKVSLRDCWQLTDSALEHVQPLLESLNLDGCVRMTASVCGILGDNCPELRQLNMRGIAVTDHAVGVLAGGCHKLETLILSSNNPFGGSLISDSGVSYMAKLSSLKSLNLQGSSVTDDALATITRCFPDLEVLNLGSCYRITDQGVGSLVEGLRKLTRLSLFQCFNISDISIHNISRNLPDLMHLDVHSCVALEKTLSILEDSPHTHNLRFIDIGSCRNIPADDVRHFRSTYPLCEVTYY